jgi:hypothetical protein
MRQFMVTQTQTKSKDRGKKKRQRRQQIYANGHRIVKLQLQTGYNTKGYLKKGFILSVPKVTVVDRFGLKRHDRFTYKVVSTSPLCLQITKLEETGANE